MASRRDGSNGRVNARLLFALLFAERDKGRGVPRAEPSNASLAMQHEAPARAATSHDGELFVPSGNSVVFLR
jgi:hypothetical protein